MKRAALVAIAVGLAVSVTSAAALAQDAPQPAAATQQPAATPKAPQMKASPNKATAKKATAKKAGPWSGSWSGSLVQVGRSRPFAFQVTIAGKKGSSSYPDDHCTGKLARVGTSGTYEFFTETITQGKFDPATKRGCVDGSLTFIKDTNGLVVTWVAAHAGQAIVAYGTLAPAK